MNLLAKLVGWLTSKKELYAKQLAEAKLKKQNQNLNNQMQKMTEQTLVKNNVAYRDGQLQGSNIGEGPIPMMSKQIKKVYNYYFSKFYDQKQRRPKRKKTNYLNKKKKK